jgi:Bacterial pre-peptidase C-terminal domain
MSQKHSIAARTGQLRGKCVLFLAIALGSLFLTPAQAQNPCETALQSSTGIVDLTPSSPYEAESAVAEWESEIIKFKVSRAGLLSLDVEDNGAEASLETQEGSGVRMVNRAPVEPGGEVLTPVVPGEVYCLRLDPDASTGTLALHLDLTDVCQLDPNADDHGNTFACATEIALDDELAGSITAVDSDVFSFSLETGGDVEIQSDGGVDTAGRLYDETGSLLDSDDDSGPGLGFLLSQTLPAGRYFVRVESSNSAAGAYTLSLGEAP